MRHSTLLQRKQQLETELEQINKQLNDRRPPRTMEEVVEAVKPFWFNNSHGAPASAGCIFRSQTHSESAARQLQAFNDVQNICKALNDYYGGDGKWYVHIDFDRPIEVLCGRAISHHAITNLYSPEACQEFLNNPEFMERLRTLYTPCE